MHLDAYKCPPTPLKKKKYFGHSKPHTCSVKVLLVSLNFFWDGSSNSSDGLLGLFIPKHYI